MSKKSACIFGIIVGIFVIIIGIMLQNTTIYSIGEPIKFNGDFYTEIYDVTKDVGRAINNAINDLICALGWLTIAIGAIVISFFTYKLCSITTVAEKTQKQFNTTSQNTTLTNSNTTILGENKKSGAVVPDKEKTNKFVIDGTTLKKYNGNEEHPIIPNIITIIGDLAFYKNDDLVSISLPTSVVAIESYAFYSCKMLAKITIPKSVTRIDQNAFYGCGNPMICAPKDSYAAQYAKENNIYFVAI